MDLTGPRELCEAKPQSPNAQRQFAILHFHHHFLRRPFFFMFFSSVIAIEVVSVLGGSFAICQMLQLTPAISSVGDDLHTAVLEGKLSCLGGKKKREKKFKVQHKIYEAFNMFFYRKALALEETP